MPRNFLNWIDRDSRIITIVRGIRTLGQAAITLLLALYLSALGFSLIRIGLVLSIDVAGTFFLALLVAVIGNRFGRRHLLAIIMFLAAFASLVMAVTRSFPVILVAIFFGSFTAGAGAGGPLQPLEVSSIAEVSPADRRTRLMGVMFIVGTAAAAFGALLVALPAFTQQLFHLDKITSFRVVFILYTLIQLVSAFLYLRLSSLVEAKVTKRQWINPFKLKSRKRIFTLTALFAADGFGGALVGQSLVALWFSTKFGLNLNSLSLVFFFSSFVERRIHLGLCQDCRTYRATENHGFYAHSFQCVFDCGRILSVCLVSYLFLPTAFCAFTDGCAGRDLHNGGSGT